MQNSLKYELTRRRTVLTNVGEEVGKFENNMRWIKCNKNIIYTSCANFPNLKCSSTSVLYWWSGWKQWRLLFWKHLDIMGVNNPIKDGWIPFRCFSSRVTPGLLFLGVYFAQSKSFFIFLKKTSFHCDFALNSQVPQMLIFPPIPVQVKCNQQQQFLYVILGFSRM